MYSKQHILIRLALVLIALFSVRAANATNYYFKSGGNDSYGGTTPATAWKSLSKLYSITLLAGDSVLLNGGDTLSGNIYLSPLDSGSITYPIVFSSFGAGRGNLDAGNTYAIFIYNAGGITIRNLNIWGSGMSTNTNSGIFFYTDKYATHRYPNIVLSNLFIQGFGADGITIGSSDSLYRGCQNIAISNVISQLNGSAGISTYDKADRDSIKYAFHNLYIGNCTLLYNGVNGIVTGGIDSGVIENCRASYTGYTTNKGSVGIWTWSSKNVTIQHCISDHTTTTGGDGDGFDLDGGSDHCIVQYCYSFQNSGCGYMHCDYPQSRPTRKNIIRYNLSENDGRKINKGGSSYLYVSWGTGLDSCDMYNNDGYITDNDTFMVMGLYADILSGYDSMPRMSHCAVRNNIFYVDGTSNNALVNFHSDIKPLTDTSVLLQGNDYYAVNPGSKRWLNNSRVFSTLRTWQDSTNEEKLGVSYEGYDVNPMLVNPGMGGTIFSTDSLKYIAAYKTKLGSPMVDRGLNLSAFGCDIGHTDFYGNSPRQFQQDIGMFETFNPDHVNSIQYPSAKTKLYPNPVDGMMVIENGDMANGAELKLTDVNGRVVYVNNTTANPSYIDMHNFTSGCYFLHIKTSGSTDVIKLIKR